MGSAGETVAECVADHRRPTWHAVLARLNPESRVGSHGDTELHLSNTTGVLQAPVRADGPVQLVDPDPEWAAQYAAGRRSAFGARWAPRWCVSNTLVRLRVPGACG